MVPYLARAAAAVGVAAIFMEVHQDPDKAPSDGPNMLKLKDFPALLGELVAIDAIAKRRGLRVAREVPPDSEFVAFDIGIFRISELTGHWPNILNLVSLKFRSSPKRSISAMRRTSEPRH